MNEKNVPALHHVPSQGNNPGFTFAYENLSLVEDGKGGGADCTIYLAGNPGPRGVIRQQADEILAGWNTWLMYQHQTGNQATQATR